jgi:amino acid adenylation domain-containing protein
MSGSSSLASRLAALSPAQRALLEKSLRREGSPGPAPAAAEAAGPVIPRRDPGREIPLSIDQERLWFIQQLDPESPVYNIYSAVRFYGPLHPGLLGAALDEVIRRHEVLRTRFPSRDGRPVQEIAPRLQVGVPLVDLRGLPEERRDAEAERAAGQVVRRPFHLDQLPLLRLVLIQVADEDFVQPYAFHHIVVDRTSADLLIGELQTAYRAFLERRPSPLPPLRIQFADFAVWQRRALEEEGALDADLRYWLAHLQGAPDRLSLPTDRPRPAVLSSHGARRRFTLARGQSEAFRAFAQREQVTFFIAGLAIFKALLVRLSGEERLIVGTPVDYRRGPDLDPLIGFFLNQLVLYSDLSGNPTLRELIGRVRDVAHAAYAHQDLPFTKLVESLKLERDLSRNPLTQVVFLLLPNTGGKAAAGGGEVQLTSYWVDAERTQFDINFGLWEDRELRLTGLVEYSTDLWDAPTMDRFKESYRTILAAALQDPDQRLWDIPLLAEAERQQLLHEWNAGIGAVAPPRETLHALFAAQAARTPEALAATCEGEEPLTYRELDRRSSRLADRLLARGARPGGRIGLEVERGLGMLVGILGILKAGCAYVPLDPSYPAERLAFLKEDSGVSLVVTGDDLSLDGEDRGALSHASAWGRVGEGAWPAYVIYTSGSTGRPKGVVVTHANVIRLLTSTRHWFGFGPSDVFSLFHSFAFDVSVFEIWGALLFGGRLAVVPYWVSRSPEDFHALLACEGVTVLSQTPSAFRQLLALPGELPALRWVLFAGEALDPRALRPWIERYGDECPRLINLYGITETTVHSTFRRISRAEVEEGHGSPVGVPIPDLTLHVLAPSGHPQPIGVAGELYVGGAGVAMGYLGRPELTAARFVPDPWSAESGARLYRSGDLARWLPVGELEYLGRIDHQVKVRGFRIELGEIESVLVQHPGVREAVVVARSEGGETRLTAYVVGAGETAPPVEELRTHLRERLPDYMVPAFFVTLDALPLTAHGKLDRRALPIPGTARPGLAAAYVAPRTPTEEVLCGIWSQVLGLEEVGVRDNFFALGGDSILSLRVLALAGQRGLPIALQDLFRFQTVADLAAAIQGRKIGPPRPATAPFSLVPEADRERLPEGLEDAYPLSMLQAGMLYHLARSPEDPPYHNVDSWHVRGRFEEGPFREAAQRVVDRHPTLRTSFAMTGFGEPLQLVHRHAVLPIEVEDLRGLSPEEQESALDRICAREKRRLFDPSEAPQWRFHIALRAADEFQFTLAENHAIIDGWSFHSTLAEIFDLYTRLLDGEDPRREPPVPLTYRDYVVLERQAVESPDAQAFWSRTLDGAPHTVLPRWAPLHATPAGPLPWPRIRSLAVEIPKGTHKGLQALARRAAVPLKSVLLSAHLDVLARVNGQDDVMTGLVSNGRIEEPGGDEVRGLFLNTLPLRLDRGAAASWLDLAQAAFRAEEAMLPYRRVPYALLQQRFGDRPLVEVVFNYVHFHVVRDMMRTGRLEILGMRRSEGSNFRFSAHFSQDLAATEVSVELEYDSHTVPAAQVEALAGLYSRVLAAMADDADASPRDFDLLGEAERHQLLREWNDTADFAPLPFRHLSELVEVHAASRPDSLAVAYDDLAWTYAELNAWANRLARYLRRLGVTPGGRVGLCLERSLEVLGAILGILKAGAAYVPLDPGYPAERLAFMAADAGLARLLVHTPTAGVLAGEGVRRLDLDAGREAIQAEDAANLDLDLPGESLAYVLYTSGSTGRPKGAGCHHAGVLSFVEAAHRLQPLPAETPNTLWASLSFDVSVYEIFLAWREGGWVDIVPERLRADGRAFAEWMASRQIGSAYLAPVLLPDLHDLAGQPGAGGLALRRILTGVEPIREPLLAGLAERLPGLRSLDGYGPTEATIAVAIYPVGAESPSGDLPERDTPLGRPVRGTRIRLLDRYLQPVHLGVPGELYAAGPGLAWGYLGRPDLTAERYLPDPFAEVPGDRLYRTGDLARWMTEGTLEFLGRADQQVKIRGFRVELGEIEAALAAQPAVKECAVLAREGSRAGERQLVACVVAREEGNELGARLQKALREQLPDFMVPSSFVFLGALPLTPTGKIDRRALASLAVPAASARPYVAPSNFLEQTLVEVAHQVLRLPVDRLIGLHDNFFELGGHSLLATQLAVVLRDEHGIEVPLPLLFDTADFGELAERIAEHSLEEVDEATLDELLAAMEGEL